jgi:tRNA A37 threonylcarbamoyladenosine dehydratase
MKMEHETSIRFGGISRLYGEAALAALTAAHVTIVGLGGVGSWAAEALVRSGVGHLTLIDLDDICLSNTNRQIHALKGCYGKLKVEVMAERLSAINPACHITPIEDFVTLDRLARYLVPSTHYVVDAIDNVKIKVGMIVHCQQVGIPILVIGGAGGKIDPTQIRMADLAFSHQDPLLAKVRATLRRNYGFPRKLQKKFKIDCVYSEEPLRYLQEDGTIGLQKPLKAEARLDCQSGFGTSMAVTASFGLFASAHILQKLANR